MVLKQHLHARYPVVLVRISYFLGYLKGVARSERGYGCLWKLLAVNLGVLERKADAMKGYT
jgi:hypothetical protein